MRRFTLLLIALAMIAAACSGGDRSGNSDAASKDDDLRAAVDGAFEAFVEADAGRLYNYFSQDFRQRCDEKDFKRIIGIAAIFLGDLEAHIEVTGVQIDGNEATVDVAILSDDPSLSVSEDGEESFLDTWVYEDGGWKAVVENANPCDLDSTFGGDAGEGERMPVTGPGTSREEAVTVGETVSTAGLDVTVLEADLDASERVMELSEFAELLAANRFVLLRVRVRHSGEGEETRQVSSSDFKLTGSLNILYDTFDQATSCGFFGGELSGEMFPGGQLEGYVCFQVPADETELILVVEPFASFDDGARRFIALE